MRTAPIGNAKASPLTATPPSAIPQISKERRASRRAPASHATHQIEPPARRITVSNHRAPPHHRIQSPTGLTRVKLSGRCLVRRSARGDRRHVLVALLPPPERGRGRCSRARDRPRRNSRCARADDRRALRSRSAGAAALRRGHDQVGVFADDPRVVEQALLERVINEQIFRSRSTALARARRTSAQLRRTSKSSAAKTAQTPRRVLAAVARAPFPSPRVARHRIDRRDRFSALIDRVVDEVGVAAVLVRLCATRNRRRRGSKDRRCRACRLDTATHPPRRVLDRGDVGLVGAVVLRRASATASAR